MECVDAAGQGRDPEWEVATILERGCVMLPGRAFVKVLARVFEMARARAYEMCRVRVVV